MTSPPATADRPAGKPAGRPAVGRLLLDLASLLVFLLVLRHAAYLEFPRQVMSFKAGGPPGTVARREFTVRPGPGNNIWTLELTVPAASPKSPRLEAVLNGVSLGAREPSGRRLLLDFPGERLVPGLNVLEVRATEPWAFHRLRIKNNYGYSSGFPQAVVFHRDNTYPEARRLPLGSAAGLGTIFFLLLAAAAGAAADFGGRTGRGFLPVLAGTRYLIAGLLLAALLLPLFSRFRLGFEWTSVLVLALVFYALVFVRRLAGGLTTALRLIVSLGAAAGSRARRLAARLAEGRAAVDLISWLIIVALAFIGLVKPGPVVRSGDSLEYVSMLVSWAEFGRPYVTSDSIKTMEKRLGQAPAPGESAFFTSFKERFPSLLKNETEMDLPHFWFYSLAAAVFYHPLRLLSLEIGLAFMLLHLLVLVAGFLVIRRALGRWAGLSFLALVAFSPLVWFVNKVHVELVTVVLACVGAALLTAGRRAGAALSFALAATQNPPFAILAGLVFLIAVAREKRAVVLGRWAVWAAAGLLAAAQPAYYLLRLGILNPVVATGAARMDTDVFSLRRMLSFIVDPDIGLIANWPVVLIVLVLFAVRAAGRKAGLPGETWAFLAVCLPVLLWSQSRSLNLNHGGTFYISRYALWYLFVLFLFLWQIGLSFRSSGRAARHAWTAVGVIAGTLTLVQFWPARPEEYLRPTPVSMWLYSRFPAVYDPMPEIFTERYRRIEEHLPEDVWAVSNPTGSKILIRWGRMQVVRYWPKLDPIPTCPALDPDLVYTEAQLRFEAAPRKKYLYLNGLAEKLKRPPGRTAVPPAGSNPD